MLNVRYNSSVKVLDFCLLGVFFFLIADLISLLIFSLFTFSIISWFNIVHINLCFFLNCPLNWHIIVHSNLWFFVFLWWKFQLFIYNPCFYLFGLLFLCVCVFVCVCVCCLYVCAFPLDWLIVYLYSLSFWRTSS